MHARRASNSMIFTFYRWSNIDKIPDIIETGVEYKLVYYQPDAKSGYKISSLEKLEG